MVSGETRDLLLWCAPFWYLSPYFINSQANQTAEPDDRYIVVYDKKIPNVRETLPLHEDIAKARTNAVAGQLLATEAMVAGLPTDDDHRHPMPAFCRYARRHDATCVRTFTLNRPAASSAIGGGEISTLDPGRPAEHHLGSAVPRRHPIFASLTQQQIERLLRGSRIECFSAGQLVYARGDVSRRFFLILEGQVHLSLHTAQGAEKIVELQGPGDVFAEAVAFMERPVYQMTAAVATATRVMSFQNQAYIEVLRENPEACLRVLQHITSRLHARIREIGEIVLESATSRLARFLEDRVPADATDPATIRLEESRQELASYLAVKPETLSRALRTLVDIGAIAVRGKTIEVLSRARLCTYLEDPESLRPHA